jgi:hypothetical protein
LSGFSWAFMQTQFGAAGGGASVSAEFVVA